MLGGIRYAFQALLERLARVRQSAKEQADHWQEWLPGWPTELYIFLLLSIFIGSTALTTVYLAMAPPRAEIASQFPTWEAAIAAVRAECDRQEGKEIYVTRYPEKVAIEAVCYHETGKRVIGYRLEWITNTEQQIRVRTLEPLLARPAD